MALCAVGKNELTSRSYDNSVRNQVCLGAMRNDYDDRISHIDLIDESRVDLLGNIPRQLRVPRSFP